ncbi:MAG: hypothetical protein IJX52_02710 [Oscillibacter sp.]|nr:hypothetical protein [Oscillibacter sp.]
MSKKSVKKSVRYDGPMTAGMRFFLAGCVAELYLLIIRRFYVNGTIDQVLAWYNYLLVFAVLGVIAAIAGIVLLRKWKGSKAKTEAAWYFVGGGAFAAAASLLIRYNMSALSILTTLIPVVLVIDILWWLFDKDSALSLTALAGALVMVWLLRRSGHIAVKGGAVAFLAALAALVGAVKQGKLKKVSAEGKKMLLISCGLSAIGTAAALVSSTIAYYAMWALAAVIFCMAVYYTVKQL